MMIVAALVVLIALSGFFSASETAYSSLNEIRMKSRAEAGDAAAAKVLALAGRYDDLFSAILIGNNIVNITASSLGTVLFIGLLDAERGPAVATAVLTVVILIFGEVTPKSLAKEMPEKFAAAVAPVLSAFITLMTPLTWLFSQWKKLIGHVFHTQDEPETITENELITMVSEAESEGELTDREGELIRSAIEFDDVEVGEILTPRVDVVGVKDSAPAETVAEVFAESGYSRLPVYHHTIDNVVGVLHEKDFSLARMRGQEGWRQLITPALFTTGATKISAMLRTFREEHHHIAVVVDEYGGTEGIVTLEDILEELVGEIWDEHDEAVEDFRPQKDGSWLVSGTASVDDLYEKLDIPPQQTDSNTVNGLLQDLTGHLPKVGDGFRLGDYAGVVTHAARRRVTEVRLTPRPPQAADGALRPARAAAE